MHACVSINNSNFYIYIYIVIQWGSNPIRMYLILFIDGRFCLFLLEIFLNFRYCQFHEFSAHQSKTCYYCCSLNSTVRSTRQLCIGHRPIIIIISSSNSNSSSYLIYRWFGQWNFGKANKQQPAWPLTLSSMT